MPVRLNLFIATALSAIALHTTAQKKFSYVSSIDSINLGMEMHDAENYERALELYSYAVPGDTNYEFAVYESCLSLVHSEQYEKAIEVANEGLTFKNAEEGNFRNLLGTAYDLNDNKEKAIETYTTAIARFPMDYNLYFNRAIVYQSTENYEAMYDDLKKATEINPYHPASHLALAQLALNQEQYAQALLAMGYYLMLQPKTQSANDNVVFISKAVSEKVDLEPNGLIFGNEKQFNRTNQLIESYVALRDDYETPSKINFPFIKQLYLAIEQSLKIKQREGFWENYYIPFYEDIMEHDEFEALSYRMLLSSGNSKHQKIFKKNTKDIQALESRLGPLIKVLYSKHHEGYESANPEIKFWFFDNGNAVQAVGKVNAENQPEGPYSYYYTNGAVSTDANFDQNGERDGDWKFYFPNGNIKGTNSYEHGKLNGPDIDYFENGLQNVVSGFADDERDGPTCVYNETGTLDRCMNYTAGSMEDSLVYYYHNGQAERWLPMTDGNINGEAIYYNEDGSLSSRVTWKDDKREGPFEGFYYNGNIYSRGNYLAGKYSGIRTSYYLNGQIKSEGQYIEGIKAGEWKHYFYDGKPSQTETFDEKGKANGIEVNYDYNGHKVSSYEYSKGEIVSYKIFGTDGEVIHEAQRKQGAFEYSNFTLNGVKITEGLYEGDHKSGKWKYYTHNGVLFEEENFDEEGNQIDLWTQYHKNGKIKRQATYVKDTLNGYDVAYHDNGKIREHGYNWNGKANGRWEDYYQDGTLHAVNFYVNGRYNGPQYFYDVTGDLRLVEYYDMGTHLQLDNCNKDSSVYSSHKTVNPKDTISSHYPNGQKLNEITVVGNKYFGPAKWWYGTGALSSEGQHINGNRHGEWKWYYPSGKLKSEGTYLFGDREGEWKDYFESGQLKSLIHYENGKAHGEKTVYFFDGVIEAKTPYFQGEINGKRYFYDYDGNIDHIRFYDQGYIVGYSYLDAEGKELDMTPITKETADVVSYFPNGKVSRKYQMVNGLFEGEYTKYNDDGSVRSRTIYSEDNAIGKDQDYYKNGQLKSEQTFSFGLLHGETLNYYPNGKLKSRKQYVNNSLHGEVELYNSSGTLVKKYNYKNGFLYDEL